MTEEQLLREAKLYGAEDPEELTYGELAELLELGAERERRFLQGLALVAYRHAALTARALAGRELPAVGEAFPFWTEEELQAAKLERCRRKKRRQRTQRPVCTAQHRRRQQPPPAHHKTGEAGRHIQRPSIRNGVEEKHQIQINYHAPSPLPP